MKRRPPRSPACYRARRRLAVCGTAICCLWLFAMTRPAVELWFHDPDYPLVPVAFTWQDHEPGDAEVEVMIDEVLEQLLGPQRLGALIDPGDRVVIKTNMVGASWGATGEQGRGIITDTRILRYVAGLVRDLIGSEGRLYVADGLFYPNENPSETGDSGEFTKSFYWARFERTDNDIPDEGDICCDLDHDGILDGGSEAQLVNLDAMGRSRRFATTLAMPLLGRVDVWLPKLLRTRQQAIDAGEPDTYCDVLIGLPVLKSHVLAGFSGSIKLHYGLRSNFAFGGTGGFLGEDGRGGHSGTRTPCDGAFLDEYLVAQHLVRTYDLVLFDCLVGNRQGPMTPNFGMSEQADLIYPHALMAATNPVAIDTVGALLAGYRPQSAQYLERARREGLGPCQPKQIHVIGWEAFSACRASLAERYGPEGRYPFHNCYNWYSWEVPWSMPWGGVSLHNDLVSPATPALAAPRRLDGSLYGFPYTSADAETGIVRVELLLDGALVACSEEAEGVFEVDFRELGEGDHTAQVAAWDATLNCTRSPLHTFTVSHGGTFGLW